MYVVYIIQLLFFLGLLMSVGFGIVVWLHYIKW